MQRAEVLDRAKAAVCDRPAVYGPPENNFLRIAKLWNAHMDNVWDAAHAPVSHPAFTAVDVASLLALVKLARLAQSPDHLDSWVDWAGYAACGAEVAGASDPDPCLQEPPFTALGAEERRIAASRAVALQRCSDPDPCLQEPLPRDYRRVSDVKPEPAFKVGDEVAYVRGNRWGYFSAQPRFVQHIHPNGRVDLMDADKRKMASRVPAEYIERIYIERVV